MASVDITLQDTEFLALLQRISHYTEDFRPLLLRLGIYMMRSIDKNFRAEGRPREWERLSEATLKRRRKGGRGARILQDTGRLRLSVVRADKGADGAVWDLTKTSLTMGSNLEYANIHQKGGVIKMPPRRMTLTFAKSKGKTLFASSTGKIKGRRHKILKTTTVTLSGHEIHIPARPYLLFQDEDSKGVARVMSTYLEQVLRPAAALWEDRT